MQIQDSYGFLLAKVEEEMEALFTECLRKLHITAPQFGILQHIEQYPNASQIQVSEALFIDRTTMVAHVDHLEKIDLIKRVRNPNDRRSFGLTVTEYGVSALKKGRKQLNKTENSVLSVLDQDEKGHLKSILKKVWNSIQEGEHDGKN